MPLVFLLILKRTLNIEFILYLSISIVSTLILTITYKLNLYNLVVFNLYVLISLFLLATFYLRILKNKKSVLLIILTSIICLFSLIWELTKTEYIELSLQFENLCFIFWSIIYFNFYLKNKATHYHEKSFVLINASIFIYNCSSFVLIYFIEYLMKNNLWFIHNFIEGSSKLLIAYAIWKLPKTSHY